MTKKSKPDSTEDDVFQQYVNGVTPLKHDRVYFPPKKPKIKPPVSKKAKAPDFAEPEIMLTDNFTEIAAEEQLFFARSGLQTKLIRKLRRGQFPIEKSLDLHGYTIQESKQIFWQFLQQCLEANMRHVMIVHGKGRHSKEQKATLKDAVNCWLGQIPEVLAFCSAQPKDGGRGALYILLKRNKGVNGAE